MSLKASISNISRASLHDGPGIRTVVYFKGCGLRCRWCHNPETLDIRRDILYAQVKCIRCGRCVNLCPEGHRIQGDHMELARENCRRCGECADVCPTGALSVSGEERDLDQVFREAVKDRHYFAESGGGVTLSGGECLLQADFCAELLQKLKNEGIHTAIETALFVPWQKIEKVIPYTDLFFADFKMADSAKHRQYTGQENALILDNLSRLSQTAQKVVVRIPLIPGVNDAQEDVRGFAERLYPIAEKLGGIEVLKYNSLAKAKYLLSGMDYTDFGETQQNAQVEAFCSALDKALGQKNMVYTQG